MSADIYLNEKIRRKLRSLSSLPQKTRLQHHRPGIGLAVDLVIAADHADVLDLGADFERDGRALHFQVLDQHHGVAVGQRVAIGIAHHGFRFLDGLRFGMDRPFVATVGADVVGAVGIGVFQAALGTGGGGGHGGPRMKTDPAFYLAALPS